MRHPIDPKVDMVFKALFGSEANRNLLIAFLNDILALEVPVTSVQLLKPETPGRARDDKAVIVDVKARDQRGRIFQVEIQLVLEPALAERMLYGWSVIYSRQLRKGDAYADLNPVIAIWLVDAALFPHAQGWHHVFQAADRHTGLLLSDQMAIHVLELPKWRRAGGPLAGPDRWMYFLNEAGGWTTLPNELEDPEMKQAMDTLGQISDEEREYWAYFDRIENERLILSRERYRREQDEALREQESQLREQETQLREQETQLREQETQLRVQESQLREQETQLREQETQLRVQETQLRVQETQLRVQETQLRVQETQLREQETQLRVQESQLREQDERIRVLTAQVQELMAQVSRLTRPPG
ncbi:MAG: Rpn family recombination-promoting nuclease/putative transposase [Alphaproteobacteria bacterium]|nr:Rpn family recombination-promoting nuclease/putative transposase [Alphaproteobacteria bacterium]